MPAPQRRFRASRQGPATVPFNLVDTFTDAAAADQVRRRLDQLGALVRVVRCQVEREGGKVAGFAVYAREPERSRQGHKPGGGRPRAESPRTETITVAVSSTEKEKIQEQAARVRRDAGPYLRELAFGATHVEVPPVNLEAYARLGRLAVNVNQLAARLNEAAAEGRTPRPNDEDRTLLDAVRQELRALRSELRGGGE